MPIESARGNLLEARVDALVNTVNTKGAMGKGLALQFKHTFPDAAAYARACRAGEVRIGRMHIFERATSPRFIVDFPTKDDWRHPSRIEYIRDGLVDLVAKVRDLEIGSIAIPPLGCGLGRLDWADVRPLVVDAFVALPDTRVLLYEPTV